MGGTWLPTAERIDSAHAAGGTYLDDVPWRFVAHSTEVVPKNVAGARAMAARHATPPHLWYWPELRWLGQTVDLARSAFALKQPAVAAARRTNKARALQLEIIGFAAETPTWPAEWWHNIGVDVVAPLIAAGYPLNLDHVAALTGNEGYGVDGAVRMTWDEWLAFDGLCAHSNVPDNSHWDIGAGRLDLVAAAARTTNHQEDDMPTPQEFARAVVDELNLEMATPGVETLVGIPDQRGFAVLLGDIRRNSSLAMARNDPAAFAAAVAEQLDGVTAAELEAAVRRVFADAGTPG